MKINRNLYTLFNLNATFHFLGLKQYCTSKKLCNLVSGLSFM